MELTLCLTRDCNLRCSYCYAGEKQPLHMDWDTARRGMDMTFSLRDASPMNGLHFFGGEPLLQWDLLQRCDAYFMEKWATPIVKKSVTTNGTLLTSERARWLKNNGYLIGLSLDGAQLSHDHYRKFPNGLGSFDCIIQNADQMIKQSIPFKTIMVISPAHLSRLPSDVQKLYNLGFRFFSLNINTRASWSSWQLLRLKKSLVRLGIWYLKQKTTDSSLYINIFDGKVAVLKAGGYQNHDRCDMGIRELTLSALGVFYPCERFVGNEDDPSVQIGSLEKGLDHKKIDAMREQINLPECQICLYSPYCVNWCGCSNYSATGRWREMPGFLCRVEQILIDIARGMTGL